MMRQILKARVRGDQGVALVTVIAISAVLAVLVVSATAFTIGTQRKARNDQDWSAALAAAYAGIEEYQSRLANDPGYFVFGNPASEFSVTTGSNVRLPELTGGPDAANPAFGVGPTGPWAEVPGSAGGAHFRYEVDNSEYYATGTLRIRSTGRAAGQTRSILADLRQTGFIEFLYFTDYEILDPEISGSDPDACNRYRYQGRSTSNPPGGCGTINFITADVFNGPLHTNDAFQVSGNPTFNGWTTTSYNPTSGPRYFGTGSPRFTAMPGGQPAYMAPLGMPKTNSELKKETRPDIPDLVPRPGCLYTGPTTIQFHSNGDMTVRSPWTKFTSPVAGVNNAGCGTPGSTGLARSGGQRIPAPDNNVIFIQNVPADPGDANYWADGEPGTPTCLPQDRSRSDGRNAEGNPVGYPLDGEYVANSSVYGCRNGDGFVEGTVDAKVTVAAENYLYITGDIVYEDDNDDILGLVGQNAVYVHNPESQQSTGYTNQETVVARENNVLRARARTLTGTSSGTPNTMTGNGWRCTRRSGNNSNARYDCARYETHRVYSFRGSGSILNNSSYRNRRIDAAILSVAHTFMVQNYDKGNNRGTLTVNGAIAQKYRGTVGTGSGGSVGTGYGKNYNYDERFRYIAPPKFLSPVTTVYGVTVWVELSPVMSADGSYR